MDGSSQKIKEGGRVVPPQPPVTSPKHPLQLWLAADAHDFAANSSAYRAACPDLTNGQCAEVFALCDSAQYEFIKLLIWDRSFGQDEAGNFMSVDEALQGAREEHQRLDKK